MNSEQELFVILMEECAELAHVASKCARFGYGDTYNDVATYERLEQEIGDVFAIVDILQMMDIVSFTAIEKASEKKLKKLKEWSNLREALERL
jgi:NTP pyrophosphatase (non-canonical NTP hydrolase)